MLLIQPFSWPVQGDRAFLIYMAQVVARGEPLYAATPFGYTPLSALIGGGWIWLTSTVTDLPGYLSLRVLGLICYPLTGMAIYHLLRGITQRSVLVWVGVLLFAGFGMPMMIGCINAEPKILVVLFASLGMAAVLKERWLQAGLCAGLCVLAWHPAGLYGLAMLMTVMAGGGAQRWKAASRLVIGGLLALSVLVLYLSVTGTWQPAWNQLVLKHLANEASRLAEAPLRWVPEISRGFLTEVPHFILAAAGVVIAIVRPGKTMLARPGSGMLFGGAIVLWLLFYSMEFQSHVDFIVILPLITVWAVVALERVMDLVSLPAWLWIVGVGIYGLGDVPFMRPRMTLDEQRAWIQELADRYPDRPFVASRAEQVHVLLERQMPLKFIRYHNMEEVVVELEGGCARMGQQLADLSEFILIVRRTEPRHYHACAAGHFSALCGGEPVAVYREPASMLPIPRLNTWYAQYHVYECGKVGDRRLDVRD